MTGLLIKDFYCMKRYMRQYIMLLVLFMVIGVMMRSPFYVVMMGMIMGMTFMMAIIGIDENGGFTYSLTLPVSRSKIIGEKYLLLLIWMGIIFLTSFIGGTLVGFWEKIEFPEWFLSSAAVVAVYMILIAILIPVALKWGVEKARTTMILLVAVPAVGIVLLSNLLAESDWAAKAVHFFETADLFIWIAGGFLAIIIFMISWRISVKIFLTKEF